MDAASAKAKIAAHFEMLRATRAPSIARLVYGGELELPMLQMRATPAIQCNPPILVTWQQIDVEGVLAYAFPALEKQLLADVDEELQGASPLTDAERARRVAEIERDSLATAREVCALVEAAHAQGRMNLEYPAEINPLAVLNAELVTSSGR
jgi:hypothetical protein